MDKFHKYRPLLYDELCLDEDDLLSSLCSRQVISSENWESILTTETFQEDKVSLLLSFLDAGGDRSYQIFEEELRRTNRYERVLQIMDSDDEKAKRRPLPPIPTEDLTTALQSYPWYFGTIDRNEVNILLGQRKSDGEFLVRVSKTGGESSPFALCVYARDRVWNVQIRKRGNQKYTLGSQSTKSFTSIPELINFYHEEAAELVATIDSEAEGYSVLLKNSPPKPE